MLATIALSLSVVCLGQAKAPSPAPEDLIERHIEATGGMRALADIKGLHRMWSLKSGEFTGTMETNWSPKAFRSKLTSSDGTWSMAWGQDAQGAWQQEPDGSIVKTAPVDALMLKLQADPGALLRRDDYLKRFAVANLVRLPSGAAWRVLAAPKLGKVMTMFFNEENGKLVAAEYWRNGPEGKRMHIEATYDDWRSKGPLQMPYRIQETSHLGDATLELTEVDIRPMRSEEVARLDARVAAPEAPAKPASYHARLMNMLGDTITAPDGSQVSSAFVAGKENVLLYFSAKWCGPCRRFTPDLVQFAKDNADGDVVILLVSSDRSASDMADYLKSYNMPFGAVDFAKTRDVKSAWAGGGIPNLVWLGPDDKVIKGSYETDGIYSPKIRGSYVGPQSVLAAFKKR